MIPGELIPADGMLTLNEGVTATTVMVANTGDRPIQVGSHYHFAETNPALDFDRDAAHGMRLDIAAGTAVRFEPGQRREVKLRLADTDLIIEVERDLIAERAGGNAPRYGEEVKFGGGKVIRDGMGQSQVTRADGAVDTVITNALIVDYTGIYKADVGLKDGRIHKIGPLHLPAAD